jgi:hypothetical protein
MTAPTTSGWSIFAGWDLHPLESAAFHGAHPELPETLNATSRERKARLLEVGLSDFYVGLCFEAFSRGAISVGRLAEALLCSQGELGELANIYGRTLRGD